jgi:two-component system CheB/CheR fusion protein
MSTTKEEISASQDLVVVGSSAGGIEALSTLVGSLPANFPAPIVLAQHLDPHRPSSLHTILQRKTVLTVEVITSHRDLRPGTIYVVPANFHVSIHNHTVQIHNDTIRRPRPSVDTLLSTAADAYGDRLIAVILTGSGIDGAIGAVDVKNAGGTVIVQDPQTAHNPSMPMALPPTIIDFTVTLDQMGTLLSELIRGEHLPQSESKVGDVLKNILEHVGRQANIDFRQYKTSTILRRIGRRMTVTHSPTMLDYLHYLRTVPEEVGELVKAFLINVTQFFRDPEAFNYLKTEILPKIIEHARTRDHVLRFWTAGCATGEEPYSLAMLITDLLHNELPEWSIKIFATDLDESAISFARRGLYTENMLKGIPTNYQDRFFEHVDQGYHISKTLRQMVIFGQQDLSKSAPFPRIDLVLCRNVLIYFTPELQDYVLSQFAFSLNAHGYLFLGKAETVRPSHSHYELVNKHWKIYACTGNAIPLIRLQPFTMMRIPHLEGHAMNRPHRTVGKLKNDKDTESAQGDEGQFHNFDDLLLRFTPIGVIVIDRSYRIHKINSAARRLLGLREAAAEQDFLHAVRGIPYQEIRDAIDSVFREHTAITLTEVELDINAGGNGRFVNLSIAPMQFETNTPDFAALSVTDVTEQVQIRNQLQTAHAEQTQLMNELSSANKRLSDLNKELTDTNEELQVSNEELVLTHEELQASIEEFETTNEELQATNEELETNNEELQATNEELETTNDELRARTSELQEIMSVLEGERLRLSEMVKSAPFYILVLRGPALLIDAYNPRYTRFLEGRSVHGQPLEEVMEIFWEDSVALKIISLIREVYRLETTRSFPLQLTFPQSSEGTKKSMAHRFIYTFVPSHDSSGRVDEVIVYAIDETEQQETEQ